ncbi:hypothetical protein BC828DRAFT_380460 [Blastocladiella britannica]|nr:hypothetical protein BC828DRAFT_380460 [Blastocladiella britannica]
MSPTPVAAPLLLQEAARAGISHAIDPFRLLGFVQFPLDKYIALVHNSTTIRIAAALACELPLPESDPEYEAVKRNPFFVTHLQREAAALTIQCNWKTHCTRHKYTCVRFGLASRQTADGQSRRPRTPDSDWAPSEASSVDLKMRTQAAVNIQPKKEELDLEQEQQQLSDEPIDPSKPWKTPYIQHMYWEFGTASRTKLSSSILALDHMRTRYRRYCGLVESLGQIPPHFDDYCARKVQALWKSWTAQVALRRTLASIHEAMARGEKGGVNYLAREHARRKVHELRKNLDGMATRIQHAWRRYWDRRIFSYLRDLIRTREKTDTKSILKFINPKESQLMDRAAGLHVRFRLGGSHFPPTVYYKIFVHRPTIDLGAFAPRNYANPVVAQTKKQWYQRIENNGWRPIFQPTNPYDMLNDPLFVKSSYAPVKYTAPLPAIRREDRAKRQKQKKMAWLKKLYADGGSGAQAPTITSTGSTSMGISSADSGTFAANDDLDEEASVLGWTAALNFDTYMRDWLMLATSGPELTMRSNDRGNGQQNTKAFINAVERVAGLVDGTRDHAAQNDDDDDDDTVRGMAEGDTDDEDAWWIPGVSVASSRISSARSRSGGAGMLEKVGLPSSRVGSARSRGAQV